MRSIWPATIVVCLALALEFAPHRVRAQSANAEPVQHEFIIVNFKTESGAVLPEAHVLYGTYGQLNAAGDNAVLLPSHYMADMRGYGFVIGPG